MVHCVWLECKTHALILLGYCVVPDWLEEKLQHWEHPIIKVCQKWFLNIITLLLNRIIAGNSTAPLSNCINICYALL